MEELKKKEKGEKLKRWVRTLGWAGVLFFLIKGLIWLAVFFGLGKLISF